LDKSQNQVECGSIFTGSNAAARNRGAVVVNRLGCRKSAIVLRVRGEAPVVLLDKEWDPQGAAWPPFAGGVALF
jgi:hypothetical protein